MMPRPKKRGGILFWGYRNPWHGSSKSPETALVVLFALFLFPSEFLVGRGGPALVQHNHAERFDARKLVCVMHFLLQKKNQS